MITSKTVHTAITALNTLGKDVHTLRLSWIKAHIGHPGNEAADEAARMAMHISLDLSPPTNTPWAVVKSQIHTLYTQKWTNQWTSHNSCRQTKNFFPTPSASQSRATLKHSSRNLRLLIEAITGQNNLNYLQSKINPHTDPSLCRFCEEEDETFIHLINDCPCFLSLQRDLFAYKEIHNTLNWDPKLLLRFIHHLPILEALSHPPSEPDSSF